MPEIPQRHRRSRRHRKIILVHRRRDGDGLRQKTPSATTPRDHSSVWYWNGEDPREEIERRVVATCSHYCVGADDIGDRLFFNSGRDDGMEIIIASQTKSGTLIATPVEDALTDALIDGKFDVLILDPFVSTHRVTRKRQYGHRRSRENTRAHRRERKLRNRTHPPRSQNKRRRNHRGRRPRRQRHGRRCSIRPRPQPHVEG